MGTDGSLAVDRDGVQHAQCWRLSKETLQRQMLNTNAGLGPSHVPGADLPFRASRSDDKLLFGLAHRLLPSATCRSRVAWRQSPGFSRFSPPMEM